MWNIFSQMAGSAYNHEFWSTSLLLHVKFDHWSFDFPIWSTARMVGYGLLVGHDEKIHDMQAAYYEAWGSLLRKEERMEVDGRCKKIRKQLMGDVVPA